MRRLRLKRDLFDGEKLWDAGEADVSDLFQPPRDAEVWDGDKFVPVPLGKDGNVDMVGLDLTAGEVPEPDEPDDEIFYEKPKRASRRK
jgi:hypothetical protein